MNRREDMIEALQELQKEFPDKSITRKFFRDTTNYWSNQIAREFGTFTELKRQAGLMPTRKETKLINAKAKNVEEKRLFDIGLDRLSWKDKYPINSDYHRFHIMLVTCDQHDIMCDPFYRRMTVRAAEEMQPHKIIFNGDLFDNPEFSTYRKRASDYNPVERMKWVHNYLEDFKNVSPDSELNFVEGNHEYRLVSHLMEKSPMTMDILSSNGIGVKEFLGLDKYQVNYHAKADFATFTEADIKKQIARNYYQFQEFVLFHHFPEGKKFGMPGCSGHNHKYEAIAMSNKTYGSYKWHHLGGGVRRHVEYLTTMGENWDNTFMIVVVDLWNRYNTMFTPVDCTHEHCVLNGTIYSRTDEEKAYLVE